MKRKLLLVPILAAIIVTGCGQTDTASQSSNEEDISGLEPVQESKEAETDNDADIELASEAETAYDYTDEAGRVIHFDKAPERIVTTYLPLWESLILLGESPVGAASADNYIATWDAFEGQDIGEVVDLGNGEVNLELLTELKPDLIMDQTYDISSYDITNYEQISSVAVFGPKAKTDWRYNLREVAKVTNQSDKADQIIADVEKQLDNARAKIKDQYQDKTVMQMSLMSIDKFYILYRPDLYDSEKGLGLTPPEGFTSETNYVQITMEALVAMNPDVIFVNVFDGDEAMFEEFQQNPVWQTLSAVKEGHVYRLDGSGHALSALSTIHTVNQIVDTLIEE